MPHCGAVLPTVISRIELFGLAGGGDHEAGLRAAGSELATGQSRNEDPVLIRVYAILRVLVTVIIVILVVLGSF